MAEIGGEAEGRQGDDGDHHDRDLHLRPVGGRPLRRLLEAAHQLVLLDLPLQLPFHLRLASSLRLLNSSSASGGVNPPSTAEESLRSENATLAPHLVRPARLERAACGLGNRCSILLSYGRKTRRAGLASHR